MQKRLPAICAIFLAVLLVSSCKLSLECLLLGQCSEDNDDDPAVSPTEAAPTGTLSLAITDAPADGATRVVVEIVEIELVPAAGDEIKAEFDPPLQLDLLALQGLDSELLLDALEIPAGDYESLAFRVNAGACASFEPGSTPAGSFIELEGGVIESLIFPDADLARARYPFIFTLAPDGTADYTMDFDLRKSVSKPAGVVCHHLTPDLRFVDNSTAGVIRGTVDSSLLGNEGCGDEDPATGSVVYVYAGSGVTPDDMGGSGTEPLTSERVMFNSDSGDYEYIAAFLPAGDYTVALTCQGLADQPDMDDVVMFQQPASVSVVAGETTPHNFTAEPLPP